LISDGAAGTPHPQSGTSITAGAASHPQIGADSTTTGAAGTHATGASHVVTGSQHALGA
jgi:hypothetical protein